MALRKGSITRSHEHYLRHILLLGQAAPLALNALVKMKESKHRKTINDLIRECRCRTIPPESVHINPDLWSTKTLCDVIRALFRQELSASEPEIMKSVDVINDQITDMDKYAESAALPFEVFEKKWHPLHSSLLELIKDTDSQTKFKCRRMIHSFKLEDIHVNSDLIKKLRETKDVDSHIKIVVDAKLFTEIHGKREGLENAEIQDLGNNDDSQHNTQDEDVDYPNDESTPYATAVFTEQLHDIFVYMDEPAILTCKLNTAKATVRWRKDHTPLKKTETLKFVNDQYSHWLAISNAQLTDTGLYSCVCGNATTSASLKVTAKPLELVRELHVDMEETVFWEHMDISLVCTVNLQARRPVWMHNSNRITDNNRIFASSLELEHKLIIRNARFEDKGEYTVDFGEVTSSTNLIIKGNVDPLQEKELKKELRKNWLRGALGLTHLKIGLENVADRFIKDQHSEFLTRLSAHGTVCTYCTSETLLPFHCKTNCKRKSKCACMRPKGRMPCPSRFCSRFYDMIMDSHRFFEPELKNTDVQAWNSDPWSVATCYISTTGYKGKKSASEVDCAGLLSLFINDTVLQKYIGEVDINGKTDVFKKAKDARNDIFHKPTYEISKGQLDDYITLFKNVLEIRDEFGKSPLLTEPGVTPALCSLDELQNHGIVAWPDEERMTYLHKHAMHEETEILMKAVKENDIKMRQLEEKIERMEKELQLLHGIRTSPKTNNFLKKQEVPFELALHIRVLESTSNVLVKANQLIFRIIKDVARHNNEPNITTTSTDLTFKETRLSVERILSFIYNVNDTKIADVIDSDSSIDLKIQCFSCKAIEQMLALKNGTKFQEVKFELQKYLQIEDGDENPYEVVANFSLSSLNNTWKELYDRRLVKAETPDFKCVNHTGMQIVSYCSDHDELCCATCRETVHRACFRLNQGASCQISKENNQNDIINGPLEENIELPFELELQIQVLESTSDVLVKANQLIFRIMKEDVARHNNEPNVTTMATDLIFKETRFTVKRIFSFMLFVNDTKIADVIDSGASVDIKIQCFSRKAIHQMLALINGTQFQEVKLELQKYLQMEDGAEKPYEVVANFSLRSLNNTRKELYDRMLDKEVTTDFKCVNHTGMQIVSYCSDHDQLCCATCRETVHRACFQDAPIPLSIQQIFLKKTIGAYNVRISDKGVKSDIYNCTVLKTAKLPNGKFLLADRDNYKIKKLDRVYKLVGYCILNDKPYDVCYFGNKTAAVSLGELGIQRVSVSGKMKKLDLIKLDHFCFGLDCHLDTLYVTSKSTVYAYDKNFVHQRVVYMKESNTRREALGHLIVSNDGELIYLSDAYLGLLTITRDGTVFSALKNNVLKSASGICLVNDGTILVTDEDTHSVHQVDYKGERVIGTVITEADSPQKPWSACYDEQQSRLIVGYFHQDCIIVFPIH